KPFLYVAAHGQDRASMGQYVKQVFDKFQAQNLINYPFGLAVGSLVPLRGAHKYLTIIELMRGLQENIPEALRAKIPIHVFGVTGSIIPILSYLGIDTFDSSTYIQETRSLSYIDPNTGRPQPVFEIENLYCNCRICQAINLEELQFALMSDTRGRPLPNGKYKSKYYGDVALHNLEMDFRTVDRTKEAIKSDSLQEYLIEHTDKFPKLRSALEVIANEDDSLRLRMSRTVISQPQKQKVNLKDRVISLKYTSDDFNILKRGYYPPQDKRVLLIVPCSGDKPYSQSRSHRLIEERLEKAVGQEKIKLVHKVTLSGLYGPVPEECENEPPILGYDFRLESFNQAQIDLIADRLVSYLEHHGDRYIACFGYATALAYRTALEKASQKLPYLCVLPIKPKTKRLTEFFRKENVAELVEEVKWVLKKQEGITWNFSEILEQLLQNNNLREQVEQVVVSATHKELNEQLVLHTAAHLLHRAIAAISGVNEQELEYSFRVTTRNNPPEIVVWERYEGGAGISEVFENTLRANPVEIYHELLASVLCPVDLAEDPNWTSPEELRATLVQNWCLAPNDELIDRVVQEAQAERQSLAQRQNEEDRTICRPPQGHDGCPACIHTTYCTERNNQDLSVSRLVGEAIVRCLVRRVSREEREALSDRSAALGIEPPHTLGVDREGEFFDMLFL
ncbi:MAG: DUF5591 domain-containing protein, partial [Microcoleus sp.]